ncbi:MAG: class I SAM-dependent methyltransferase [Candidatus Micrarchaeota archaeon]
MVKRIDCCRACGSKNLLPILSLGPHYVSNFVDSGILGEKIPLDLVLCDPKQGGCSLLQLTCTAPAELMYHQYWYRSGTNQTMTLALADIAKSAEKIVDVQYGDIALDIGCNDGTLLRAYSDLGLIRAGFEPGKNLIPYAKEGTGKIFDDFFNANAFISEFGEKKAKIITSIAMFYDLENPNEFVADIGKILHKDGVWIIQMSYLPLMLEQNAFDNICHEHLEYYSLKSLEYVLNRNGMAVFDVELNDVNGGSIRTYIRHSGGKPSIPGGAAQRIEKMRTKERDLRLDEKGPYEAFARRVEAIKEKVFYFIRNEVANGKKVFVYGASTKGNTLLQYFALDSKLIAAAAERNPDKWGKKTVGSLIPIISEEEARAKKPDYFLILPWHFLTEFTQREEPFLKAGGKFIVPLPEFKIISK